MELADSTVAPGTDRPAREVKHEVYWRRTEAVEPGPPLRGSARCDVCIVGGGYTGLWTAHFLKLADPSLRIRVLEADYAGAGASGHNDGFVTPTVGHSLAALVERFGQERSRVAYSVVGRSMLELGRFCRKYGVDAELEPTGYYQVASTPGQMRLIERDLEIAGRLGASLELLDGDRVRERIGSAAIRGGFKVGGALVNPHRLARGLARVVRGQGVEIHEGTAAVSVARTPAGVVVATPGGQVTAPKVLLATNAYQHQFPELRRKVAPVWSYAAVTEPLTDEQMARVHWPERGGFVEAGNFIVFGRFTAGNRLLIGGGPARYHFGRDMDERHHIGDPSATAVLRDVLGRYFPRWRDLRFSHAYGGCVAVTREFVPHVGALGGGVFYGHGYCGNGIALTHTAGKALRDLILERESAYTDLLFVGRKEKGFPAEPFTFLGARALSAVLAFQDRHPHVIKRQLI